MLDRTIRAKFSQGVITPSEKLEDMQDGTELSITIREKPNLTTQERIALTKSAAGAWKNMSDEEAQELERTIYQSRINGSRIQPNL